MITPDYELSLCLSYTVTDVCTAWLEYKPQAGSLVVEETDVAYRVCVK